MGGAPRLLALLSPSPSLRFLHRPVLVRLTGQNLKRRLSRAASACLADRLLPSSTSLIRSVLPPWPIHSQRELHSQAQFAVELPLRWSNPWPEWSAFMEFLSTLGYFNRAPSLHSQNDVMPGFPEELRRLVFSCLDFARDRPNLLGMLPRRDIELVVQNSSPDLFKNGENSAAKLRLYLDGAAGDVLDADKASTIDLMRFMLSYIGSLTFEGSGRYNRELLEPSVRNLLVELSQSRYGLSQSNPPGELPDQFPSSHEQMPESFGQRIEMKRGDWICPRCNFMNFARNVKCLECEELRPKRQLTGGEWECPQCDFFNYGRNATCLRCDCKRPGSVSVSAINSFNNPDYERRLAANEEKAKRWFSKVSQLDSNSDTNSAIADDDFPEIMPLRKGVNRFVVSTRKTPLDRRLASNNAENQRASRDNFSETRSPNNFLDAKISQTLDEILGRSSTASKSRNGASDNLKTVFGNEQNSGSGTSAPSEGSMEKLNNETEKSEKEQEVEESERWFKKVVELHNDTDFASTVSDEDFPEIMPMQKGENRFVVNRKKDHSLTSPSYRRRTAVQQSGDSKFVPFVPFPPDYFAKKAGQQPDGTESTSAAHEEDTNSVAPKSMGNTSEKLGRVDGIERMGSQQEKMEFQGDVLSEVSNSTDDKTASLFTHSREKSAGSLDTVGWNTRASVGRKCNSGSTGNGDSKTNTKEVAGSVESSQPSGDVNSSWRGKSLEGSAVREPDPLDMSEEAKAERWFKRVAQIKDISELSQIPDEDFPSIMPMRKGVNRFVVSKRKTPLERRLTNQQSRRNPPTTPSPYDPFKREGK